MEEDEKKDHITEIILKRAKEKFEKFGNKERRGKGVKIKKERKWRGRRI